MEFEDIDVGEFELLEGSSFFFLEDRWKFVMMKEWNMFFDVGIGWFIWIIDEVKECIFYGGFYFEDGVWKEVWLFLLGVYDWYGIVDEWKV